MNANRADRRIRVCFVITGLATGGAENNLVRLATGLDPCEFAVEVVSLKQAPRPPHDELVVALRRADVRMVYLNLVSAWQLPFAMWRLRRRWSLHRPAIVQSFLFHANVLCALSSARRCGAKLIWGLRGADPSPRRQWIERRLLRYADRIACVSESVADFAVNSLRAPRERLCVITNGIELELERARDIEPLPLVELGLPPGRRAILCIGRLHEQKGYDWLLAAAPELLARTPEHDLVIVGDGPERHRLLQLAAQSSVNSRIHFVGFRSDVPRCLAAADVLLLTSRWEGMPNVVLEAMAHGTPVVATNTHGVAELLGPQAVTRIVNFGDTSNLIAQLCLVLHDPQYAKRAAEEQSHRAAQLFSQAAMIDAYSDVYRVLAALTN